MRCYGSNTTIGNTAPSNPTPGAWWYNNINNTMYYWNGTSWATVNGGTNAGVMSLNGLTGNTTISAGTGISLNQVGNNIEINNTVSTGTLTPNSRIISTPMSVTGGGDLSADRTLTLVNDLVSPGNTKYYGTNSSGTKGWNDLTSIVTSIVNPLIPDTYISSESFSLAPGFSGTLNQSLTIPATARKAFINMRAAYSAGSIKWHYADGVIYKTGKTQSILGFAPDNGATSGFVATFDYTSANINLVNNNSAYGFFIDIYYYA